MSSKYSWMIITLRIVAFLAIGVCTYFLIIDDSRADDYATAAIGVFNSGKDSHAECKFVNVGHREDIGFGLTEQYEVGGWTDSAGNGRSGSAYTAYQLGVQTDGPVYARVMTGPALITSPDSYLGGVFQFTEDFYIGLKGSNGNTVGIKYKHISSAGLEQPNVGRDFAGFEVGIPF